MIDPDDAIEVPFGRVPRGRRITLDTGSQAFVRMSSPSAAGPPTLLLHGLGATGALNWAACFAPLSRTGQVAALDLRGHGRGPRVGNRFRLADCADDAAAVIRALDAGPAVVMGYSMGGPIAQLLALRHPELVTGLVLCATARDFRGRPADRARFAAIGALAAAARVGPRALGPLLPALPGSTRLTGWALAELRGHEPTGVLAAAAALGRFSSRDWVGSLDVPAIVVVHERDRAVPPHRQQKLAAAIPDARVIALDVDHLGIAREPGRYVNTLLAARRQVTARRSPAGTMVERQTA